jgi:hypothetical protein
MRYTVLMTALLFASLSNVSRADDQSDAAAIVEKGLKAIGGREKVAKYKARTWKAQGTYYGMGQGVPYAGEYSVQWPGKFRMEIVGVFAIVLNGDKGWLKMGDTVKEMSPDELAEQREEHYAGWVMTLLPLSDKAFQVSTMGETQVAGRPTLGVNVKRDGHRDVQLYFDKESGRLVKSENRVKAAELGGKEVLQEVFYSDYREVDGVLLSARVELKRDGAKFVEADNSEFKQFESLSDGAFGKP